MAEIRVRMVERDAARMRFEVTVAEGAIETRHDVTLASTDFERLAAPGENADRFVRRCFEFLLAREPKESILGRFDVSVIGRYFPEFEREIAPG
jgi:hypothetical protein